MHAVKVVAVLVMLAVASCMASDNDNDKNKKGTKRPLPSAREKVLPTMVVESTGAPVSLVVKSKVYASSQPHERVAVYALLGAKLSVGSKDTVVSDVVLVPATSLPSASVNKVGLILWPRNSTRAEIPKNFSRTSGCS